VGLDCIKRIVPEWNHQKAIKNSTAWFYQEMARRMSVKNGQQAHFFAMNIDIKKDEDVAARVTITRDILREMT
jgi:beta-lactamase class D